MKKDKVKMICIIANGEKPVKRVLDEAIVGADMLIAADGGSNICREMGIVPDVIIGDLDSSAADILEIFPESLIIHEPGQDSSDMEKAVAYAISCHPCRINIISALGYRTDHVLQNILIFYFIGLYAPKCDIEVCLYDNWGRIRFLSPGKHILKNRMGRTVSFFSLGSISKLTLRGFRYEITNEEYKENFGSLSNVYESDECEVEFTGSRLIWYECY